MIWINATFISFNGKAKDRSSPWRFRCHHEPPKTGGRTTRALALAVKRAFRGAFRFRRCLVPADGFWERWQGREETVIESFTIVVTEANELLRPIHDRMPVILDPSDYGLWLEGGPEAAGEARRLLRPYSPERMLAYPLSRRVNSPRYDDPECIAPLGEMGGRA